MLLSDLKQEVYSIWLLKKSVIWGEIKQNTFKTIAAKREADIQQKMVITESKCSISHDILSVVSLDLLYMSEVQDTF